MLVLMVLLVVAVEVRFNATVELDQSAAALRNAAMRSLARACVEQARSTLLMDIEAAMEGADEAGAGPPGGADLFGGGEDTGDALTGGAGTDLSDVIARTDSDLDEWADPEMLAPAMGGEYQLYVEVEDEDGKFNLLGLWTADEDLRLREREALRRLLDKAWEGTRFDMSYADATDVIDELERWVRGERGTFDPIPKPPLKTTIEQDEATAGTLDTSVIDVGESNYPLTVDELRLIAGVQPEQLSGFVEDDRYHPGLRELVTLWTRLELKPKPESDDPFADSPFTQGSLFDQSILDPAGGATAGAASAGGAGGAAGGAEDEELVALPDNDGLINVNTAPLVVLRAIAVDEIPTSFLEKLVEFRETIHEAREAGLTGTLFDKYNPDAAPDPADSAFATGDESDPGKFVFETVDEVFSKVEEHFGITVNLEPNIKTEFQSRLTVTSQVFTIKVLVVLPDSSDESKPPRARRSFRTTVWRMQEEAGGARMLTLRPLEDYHDPRRLSDFRGDLKDMADERLRAVPTGPGAFDF